MKKIIALNRTLSIVLLLILYSEAFGQFKSSGNWTYGTNTDVFDGEYKIASVQGTGNVFPYEKPTFSIWIMKTDSIPLVCIRSVPYSGCDGKQVKIKFDNEETVYQMVASSGANNESWFIQPYEYRFTEDFFKSLRSRNKMHIRLSSDCNQSYDCSFSLNGSTAAINFLKINYKSLFDR
jgi:hypothetical protein